VTSAAHAELVERLAAAGVATPTTFPSDEHVRAARAAEAAAPRPALPDGFEADPTWISQLRVLWVKPREADPAAVVLYFHGGGYSWMSADTHRRVMAHLAAACDAACLGVDYRRSPEARFPAAVDDALSAYAWVLAQGTDASQVVLAGDSAGGGLVLSALLAIRDRQLPQPAAAVCFSPWTDLAVTGPSADTADDPIVSGPALRSMAKAYLGDTDPRTPLASPLYGDLRGLPPLQIQVGTRESLLDDARRFVTKATGAGVEASLVEHPEVIHMWLVFDPDLPESHHAFDLAGTFARRHTGRS
jgi:epsilon-lactone hydrolase